MDSLSSNTTTPSFSSTTTTATTQLFHFISGSFRSLSLLLLAFDPAHRAIHHIQTISTLGPHQYLAANQHKDRVFTTSWALPPTLQSWVIERHDSSPWRISHLDTVPITATSSYIGVPPPFTHIYSVGGPTGEIHAVDPTTGGFGTKTQEILFVPEDQLASADKTRVGLRYGSHGIESTSTPSYSLTFVPHLGTDTIEIYSRNLTSGRLTHLSSSPSPRGPDARDGPRHVKLHPNGKILYCVTEHSNFVDLYEIDARTSTLTHISSRSLLPPHLQQPHTTTSQHHYFRGDTLLLTPPTPAHPSPYALFTTTRGSTPSLLGWLSILALDSNGYFLDISAEERGEGETVGVVRYQTRSSGGKANAIDLLAKRIVPPPPVAAAVPPQDDTAAAATTAETAAPSGPIDANPDTKPHNQHPHAPQLPRPHPKAQPHAQGQSPFSTQDHHAQLLGREQDQGVWILLTDDDEQTQPSSLSDDDVIRKPSGAVRVLEWDGWTVSDGSSGGVHEVVEWPAPQSVKAGDGSGEAEGERVIGASHAIWLV